MSPIPISLSSLKNKDANKTYLKATDSLEALRDYLEVIAAAIGAIPPSPSVLMGECSADMTASVNTITCGNLAGIFEDDVFNSGWQMVVIKNDSDADAAPVLEIRPVTDFSGATARFTTVDFSANVEADDVVLIMPPHIAHKIVALGKVTAVGTTSQLIDTIRLTQDADFWNNQVITMISGSNRGQSRLARDFASGTLTLNAALASAAAVGDYFVILSDMGVDLALVFGSEFDGSPDLYDVLVDGYDSSGATSDADGSVLEREEYIQTQLGYGVKLLTATGTNTTTIAAVAITESAGWWKNAIVLGITGHNIGVVRPVVSNTVGGAVVYPAFPESVTSGDTLLLISAYKPQVPEMQADVAVTINAILASETNVFDLSTSGYSYIVQDLWLKCANPGADTVTVRLYKLINDVLTVVSTFSIDTTNYGSYFNLMDLFGLSLLAGDNIKVTVQSSSGTYAITGQYSYSIIYTGSG